MITAMMTVLKRGGPVATALVLLASADLHGQGVSFGLAGGLSTGENLLAGEAIVDGAFPIIGGLKTDGFNVRGMVDVPFSSIPLSFRAELVYNRLSGSPNTFQGRQGEPDVRVALRDESVASLASLVIATSRTAVLAPYFIGGGGLFYTAVGTNPERASSQVVETRRSVGFGVNVGAGLRVKAGSTALLFEIRFPQPLHSNRGVGYVALTAGILF